MIKLLIDTQLPSSESIAARRNFSEILHGLPKKKTINSPWFYGAIGFSSLIFLIFLNFFV
jgi:hypothetical protein